MIAPVDQIDLLDTTDVDDPHRIHDGIVTRVVFFAEDSGRIIVRVDVDGRSESWLGLSGPLKEGATIRGRGPVEHDARWGPQRRCTSICAGTPQTADGIRRFLAGGSIHGIGPTLAGVIVDRFGADTLKVFAQRPRELLRVPGIGPRKLKSIMTTWQEHALTIELGALLSSHHVEGGMADRIIKRYGDAALHIVRTQPYRLALDVHGIGFKMADQIAIAQGIALDSPERAQAAMLHMLHEQTTRGDCYVPMRVLMKMTADLIPRPPVAGEDEETTQDALFDDIFTAITHVAATPVQGAKGTAPAPRIIVEQIPDGAIVYPRALYEAECALAARVREMLRDPGKPLAGAADAIALFERTAGVVLAPEQREAVEAAAQHKIVVVTGSPGTGKTSVSKAILSLFDAANVRYLLASPTGRAAKRLSEATGRPASTIHRMLGIRGGPDGKYAGFAHDRGNPLSTQALTLDEGSMISIDLARSVMDAVPTNARVVMIGDVDQLPSVGPGAVLRDLITSGVVPTVRLTRVYRQAEGSQIIDAALRVNTGLVPVGPSLRDNYPDGTEFFLETDVADAEDIASAAAARVVEIATNIIPARWGYDPFDDVQVIVPMIKGKCGTVALNGLLQAALNPYGDAVEHGHYKYRVGDKVIQTKNDYQRGVFNGDIGRVSRVDVDDKSLAVRMLIDGEERDVEYAKSDLNHMMLAYAISCHRFQGCQAKAVVVAMLNEHFMLLSRNWGYTAISRSERLCVLVADPRALRTAVRETRREMRRTRLVARLQQP